MSSRTRYVDPDGDGIEVETTPISVRFFRTGGGGYAGLDRDAVLRLHAALGEWLYPVHTPEWANKSLIEQMIEKAVKDQVAAVLPLHLKPVATYATAPAETSGCECGHPANFHSEENGCHHWYAGDREFCECTRGLGGLESDAFPEADPEPHDVGHAEPSGPCGALLEPGQRLIEVHDCGYVWAMHKAASPEPYSPPLHLATESECRADSQNPCIAARHLSEGESKPDTLFAPGARAYYRQALGLEPESIDHGRLMSELSRRIRPRPICVSCGHGWGEHTSGVCWGTSQTPEGVGCICTRERPGTAGTS